MTLLAVLLILWIASPALVLTAALLFYVPAQWRRHRRPIRSYAPILELQPGQRPQPLRLVDQQRA
jgi:hypothetical protein